MKHTLLLTATCLAALSAGPVLAQPTQPPLSASVGSGIDESFLVLDFENSASGIPDASYAFGYLYNPPTSGPSPTGLDMIQALANANIGLSYTSTTFSFGTAIDSFSYKGQNTNGFQGNGFWSYWLSTDGQNWTSSNIGAGDRTLSNGSYDGWAFDVNNQVTAGPTTPQATTPAVPEGGSIVLLGLGLLPLGVAARRKSIHRDA